jgi:hypothetical protein
VRRPASDPRILLLSSTAAGSRNPARTAICCAKAGLYASLYQEQFEGGQVQWRCPDVDIMTDGTVRPRDPQPTKR